MTDHDPIFKLGLILAILAIIFSIMTYIFPKYDIDTNEETNNNLFVAISGPTPVVVPTPTPIPTETPNDIIFPITGTFTISGYVKSPNNNRLSNSSIELSGNGVGISKYTDKNGNYIFDRLHNGNYTIRIDRQKWKIQLNGTDIVKNLTLSYTLMKKKK